MKKFTTLLALILCLSVSVTAFASEFTPSVESKRAPSIVMVANGDTLHPGYLAGATENIYLDEDCLYITSMSEVTDDNKSPQHALLALLYDQLSTGSMKMPYEKFKPEYTSDSMVIRDFFDLSLVCEEHWAALEADADLVLTFDLDIEANKEVCVMTYKNSEWSPIKKVVNNGDGTVTCTFEHLCPVAISVANTAVPSPGDGPTQTGDVSVMWIYGGIATASLIGIVLLLVYRRKLVAV